MTGLADLKPQPMHPADRDAESYQTARSIQQANPDWLVMWGVYSRQYVAFPLFRAPAGCIVQSTNPDALVHRMRRAEIAFASGQVPPGRPAAPSQAMHHADAAGWHGGDSPNP